MPKVSVNGFKRLMLGAVAVVIALAITSLYYQLGSYAKAQDLEAARSEYKAMAAEAKREREAASDERKVIRDAVAKINQSIGSIDTALRILLPEYRGSRRQSEAK